MGAWTRVLTAVVLAVLALGCEDEAAEVAFECLAEEGADGSSGSLAIDVGWSEGSGDDEGGEGGEGGWEGLTPGYHDDGPYDAQRGFGWLGEGEPQRKESWFVDVFPVGTHGPENPWSDHEAYQAAVQPYRTFVDGLSGYRVDVADGLYRVTLMFLEPSFPEPGLRVFDVTSNGVVLVDGLDLAAEAGQDQRMDLALDVLARDGRIELQFTPHTEAPPVLSGLRIEAATAAAAAVTGLEARAGAGEGLLRWDWPDEPVRGWRVSRAVNGGAQELVSQRLRATPSFVDRNRTEGETITYSVAAVASDCSAGAAADSGPITVAAPASFGLPVVDVTVDEADLAAIHEHPQAEMEVPASVTSEGEQGSGILRLRGQSTRWVPKRSFYVRLDEGSIDGRDRLKLLAEQSPPGRLLQLAAFDLFDRMGGVASRARAVLLRINGRVYGVYDDIEHVGDAFLTGRGVGVDDRFRVGYVDFGLVTDDQGQVSLEGFDKKENEDEPSPELEALLVWLNTAAEHELEAELEAYLDVDAMVDYVAGQILVANPEVVDGAHYLVLDPDSGAFLMVPWDLNNDTFSRAAQDLASNTAYAAAGGFQYWLWTRLFSSPTFRERLAERLDAALASEFGAPTRDAITSLDAQIAPALQVEPFLFTRRYEDWAASAPPSMRDFVDGRAAFVVDRIGELEGLGDTGLVVSGIAPAAGYIELENRTTSAVELGPCSLSAQVYELGALPLAEYGGVEPGQTLRVWTDLARPGGGYVVLSCGAAEGGDEEGGTTVSSLVFYPALGKGEIYVRAGSSWSVN